MLAWKITRDEYLRKFLEYDKDTGVLRWKTSAPRSAGRVITRNDGRYLAFTVRGKKCYAHRASWFLAYGHWPDRMIDHANGIKTDNRLCNLRVATDSQNNANRRAKQRSLPKGVYLHVTGLYHATIKKNRKKYSLGYFKTPSEAHAAYCKGAKRMFGEFARFA